MKPACSRPCRCGSACSTKHKAAAMITQLSDADHQTDWGMRIISTRIGEIQRRRLSLRFRLAALHRMGLRRRISLSSRARRLRQSARQRSVGARRLARPRHRSFVRRLLSAAFHQFAAPDLVRRHGRLPDIKRNARPFALTWKIRHGHSCAPFTRRLEYVLHNVMSAPAMLHPGLHYSRTPDSIELQMKTRRHTNIHRRL